MKRYTMAFAAATQHMPRNPERTAYRCLDSGDYEFREWSSAGALETTLRMQRSVPWHHKHWSAWIGSNMASKLLAAKPATPRTIAGEGERS